jgi:hypothetical protein
MPKLVGMERFMRTIATYFLRAKHWQLFLAFTCTWLFGPVIGIAAQISVSSKSGAVTDNLIGGGVWAFGMLCFMGWLWAMGMFCNSLNDPVTGGRTRFFQVALIYPLLYMCAFVALFFYSSSSISPWVIVPLHLFAMFCMFYDLYFVSKNLTMAETGRAATFNDYAGPFFLVWFFPLGIWFVQPRVNRLYARRKDAIAS